LHTLYQVQESYLKEEKCQKEVQSLNSLLRKLSHVQDAKVTLSNGYHVNKAITAIERLDLEVNSHNPEYSSFFLAT